jgi:hypothetical protein
MRIIKNLFNIFLKIKKIFFVKSPYQTKRIQKKILHKNIQKMSLIFKINHKLLYLIKI